MNAGVGARNARQRRGGDVRDTIREFAEQHRSTSIIVAMAVIAAVLPVLAAVPPFSLFQPHNAWVDGFANAGTYVLLAVGLNIVVGLAGLLDLGYAAFFAFGAYAYAYGASPFSHNDLPFLPLLLVGAAVAATFGVILGAPTLRLRGDYLAIVTLGFGEIVPEVITNLGPNNSFGWPNITNGTNSIFGIDQPSLGPLQFSTDQLPWYYLGLAALVAIIWLAGRLENSRLGRAWIAMREDELAAACMGINLTRTKLSAFAMGAFFSGIAGMINGSRLQTITPDSFRFEVSITILTMVVLGGMGSIPGVLIGALIVASVQLTLLDKLTTVVNGLGGLTHVAFLQTLDLTQGKNLIFGLLLVLMMIFRREGLFPSSRRRVELRPTTVHEQAEENVQLAGLREEA